MLSIIYDFRPRLSKSVEKVYDWKNADFHSIIYEMPLNPWQNISEGLNTEESSQHGFMRQKSCLTNLLEFWRS